MSENDLTDLPRTRDRRPWLLAAAAVVIVGLCVFRATRTYPPQSTSIEAPLSLPAPAFELYDENSPSHLVRLSAYLGRQRVLIAFYDGKRGPHASPALERLRADWAKLRKADVYVLAISTALPQENRKDVAKYGAYPFPLLSDVDLSVHKAWGRYDEEHGRPFEGVFLVDRKGEVAWSRDTGAPLPLANLDTALAAVEAD